MRRSFVLTPLFSCATLATLTFTSPPTRAQVIDLRPKNPFPTRNVGRTQHVTIPLPKPGLPGGEGMLSEPEFIEFQTVENVVDAQNLGGPIYAGTFESASDKSARIEFRSTVGVRVKMESGADLKNQNGTETLPTQWQTAVLGVGAFNGESFNRPGEYSSFLPAPIGTTIDWEGAPASVVKGVQARVAVTRNGLHDRAGKYEAELTLTWYRF